MSLNLQKGERIDLTKGTNIKKIQVCLGWDIKSNPSGQDFDLDASAFLLAANDKFSTEADVIYYNQKNHVSGAVNHSGDDRTGAGDITHSNDKEIIIVDLDKVPKDKEKITFVVTIFDASIRGQNFGQIKNAFIRIVNADNNTEVLRYNLTEDYSISTALIAGEVYRKGSEWKFAAVGNGLSGGLKELICKFGLVV